MFKCAVLLLDVYGPLWLGLFALIAVAYLYQPLMLHIQIREMELWQEEERQERIIIQRTVQELEKARIARESTADKKLRAAHQAPPPS